MTTREPLSSSEFFPESTCKRNRLCPPDSHAPALITPTREKRRTPTITHYISPLLQLFPYYLSSPFSSWLNTFSLYRALLSALVLFLFSENLNPFSIVPPLSHYSLFSTSCGWMDEKRNQRQFFINNNSILCKRPAAVRRGFHSTTWGHSGQNTPITEVGNYNCANSVIRNRQIFTEWQQCSCCEVSSPSHWVCFEIMKQWLWWLVCLSLYQ